MNINNEQECLETWENDLASSPEDQSIPEWDKDRVLYELDILYNDMWTTMAFHGAWSL